MSEPQDDLLHPDEIEALLNANVKPPAADDPAGDAADIPPDDLDELLGQQDSAAPDVRHDAAAEELLDRAEADLAAALTGDGPRRKPPKDRGTPEAYQFQSFDPSTGKSATPLPLKALQDVELDLRIELGRTEMLIEDVVNLREGSVVPLDKLAGDPVDIWVNGRLVARGEVLVLNDNFCVRVAEILTPAA